MSKNNQYYKKSLYLTLLIVAAVLTLALQASHYERLKITGMQAGGITQSFVLTTGDNFVGLIVDKGPSYIAEQFLIDLNNSFQGEAVEGNKVSYVTRWYAGRWDIHSIGSDANNFAIVPGAGYVVKAVASGTSTLSGTASSLTSITLLPGWSAISFPVMPDGVTNAESLLQAMKQQGANVISAARMNATGGFETHSINTTTNNFAIQVGEGYHVRNNGTTKTYQFVGWTPPGNISVTAVDQNSTPVTANVFVDEVSKGTSPITISNLTAGQHIVKVTKDGYLNYTATVTVVSDQTSIVTATLSPVPAAPQTGNLSVTTDPPSATLYVNDTNKGTTPLNVTGLNSGQYTLKITKTGYEDYTTTVAITSGQTANVSATLTVKGVTLQNDTTQPMNQPLTLEETNQPLEGNEPQIAICSQYTSQSSCPTAECKWCETDNSCRNTAEACPMACKGSVALSIQHDEIKSVASISGLTDCDNKIVYIMENNCASGALVSCSVAGSGCVGEFPSPSPGATYYACIDMDDNGIFETTEQAFQVVSAQQSAGVAKEQPPFKFNYLFLIIPVGIILIGVAVYFFVLRKKTKKVDEYEKLKEKWKRLSQQKKQYTQ